MKIAVLADIHSNLEALEAVLADAGGIKEIWCLGDIVGYGPNPNECCAIIKKKAKYCLAGNHDWGVVGKMRIDWFNSQAAAALKNNEKILNGENKAYLNSLPLKEKIGKILLVHASPRLPLTEYLFEDWRVQRAFESFSEKICFVGHTHLPAVFQKGERRIINPGSVGQPRDGDWRASYGVFDDKNLTFELRRVKYPIEKTQAKMVKLKISPFLIKRLALGK